MEKNGVFFIKDRYFEDFPDEKLKKNKDENRPCYYAIEDNQGLLWFIPMSTKVEKFKRLIKIKEEQKKRCDVFHIEKFCGKESVFIIGDLFPVTKEYIERAYTISEKAVVIKDKSTINRIEKKFNKVLTLIRRGIKLHDEQPDILLIESKLLENVKNKN